MNANDSIIRVLPIPVQAFSGYVPDAATVVYTFTANPARGRGYGEIVSADFTNVSGGTEEVTVRIVPAGGTITSSEWDRVNPLSGGVLESGQTLYGRKDEKGLYMKGGDQLVLLASAASAIAGNVWVEETK